MCVNNVDFFFKDEMLHRNFARKIKFLKKDGYANGPIRRHFY